MKISKYILESINRGIKLALDDYEDIEQNNSVSSLNDIIKDEQAIKNRVELSKFVVDLDLPSGTMWCKYNVGVNPKKLDKAKDWYGKYYAWGETKDWYGEDGKIKKKEIFKFATYKYAESSYNTLTKYCDERRFGYKGYVDDLTSLELKDDAAFVNMHYHQFKFCMPTKEQFDELLKYTTHMYVNHYNYILNLNGMVFTAKNGKQLFLPAAGYYNENGFYPFDIGQYWTSTLNVSYSSNAWGMSFNHQSNNNQIAPEVNAYKRSKGCSIRPILKLN